MALNGHSPLQMRQPEHCSSITLARTGSRAISFCSILPSTRAAAAAPWTTLAGISFGPCAQPAMKMPSVMVATGSSLGCLSMYQPLDEQEMPKSLAVAFASWRGSKPGRQDHHVHRDAALLAGQRVFHLDDQLAFLGWHARHIGDLGHLAANEERAFLQHPLIELVVVLAWACGCRCRSCRPWRRCARGRDGRT